MAVVDDLRALGANELAQLLTARPELADPPPATLTDLATRASAPYSVQQCLGTLDVFGIQILHGVLLLEGSATPERVAALAAQPPDLLAVSAELARLRTLGLVAQHNHVWRLTLPVARVMGRPFGLGETLERSFDRHGPSDLRVIAENLGLDAPVGKIGLIRAIAEFLRDEENLARVMDRLPRATAELLARTVAEGSSVMHVPGLMQRARVPLEAAQLLSHGLIVPLDWDQAEIPREITLQLLGGLPIDQFQAAAPPVRFDGAPGPFERIAPPALVDLVTRVVLRAAEQPLVTLKAGGLGATVMKLVAKDLGVELALAVRVVVLAGAAGLLSVDLTRGEATVTPTGSDWLASDAASRWLSLVEGWRTATFDTTDYVAAEGALAPLRVDGVVTTQPWRRARVMAAIATGSGSAPAMASNAGGASDLVGNAVDIASLVRHVLWDGPVRWNSYDRSATDSVMAVVGDLHVLGLVRNGLLTPAAHALLAGDPLRVLELVRPEFPVPLDTFTVLADLTAIAPGELRSEVAAELAVLAEVESRGGATTLRFTDASLTKAMDRGRSPEAIAEFLRAHARPSVPQTLSVLVSDVGRRHGRLRTGAAASYLRADDPATLAIVVNHRKMSKARLRLLAPTVAISPLEPDKLLKAVREAGFAPMPEDSGGAVLVSVADPGVRRVFARPLPDRFALEAERAWSGGLAGADVHKLVPSTAVRKLADRLRAGRA